MVRAEAADHGLIAGPATGTLGRGDAVDMTTVGAENAVLQLLPGCGGPVGQLATAIKCQVGGFRHGDPPRNWGLQWCAASSGFSSRLRVAFVS